MILKFLYKEQGDFIGKNEIFIYEFIGKYKEILISFEIYGELCKIVRILLRLGCRFEFLLENVFINICYGKHYLLRYY